MGYDISVFLEFFDGQQWITPDTALVNNISYDDHVSPAPFTILMLEDRSYLEKLIFGEYGPFLVQRGLPSDISEPVKKKLEYYSVRSDTNAIQAFVSLSDLNLKNWAHLTVFAECKVPARIAHLFSDGCGALPAVGLAERGISEYGIDNHFARQVRFGDFEPENWTGHKQFHLSSLDPDYLVRVTWLENIIDLLNPEQRDVFSKLAEICDHEKYRLIFVVI